jgi:PD-(D/E)XK endonuclease
VVFATTRYTGRKHRTYQDHEIDYFGVYCRDTDAVYLVPIKDVGPHTSAYLRVEPAKNNQAKGVRWAMDYEALPSRSDAGARLCPYGAGPASSVRDRFSGVYEGLWRSW